MSAAMPKNKNRSPNNIRLYLEKIRCQDSMYVSPRRITGEVLDIFIAREDPCFYRHCGVLPGSMFRAFMYGI